MNDGDLRRDPPRRRVERVIPVSIPGSDPVDLLARDSGLSRQRIKLAMEKGAVWLQRGRRAHRIRRRRSELRAGDRLCLYYDERVLAARSVAAELVADAGRYSVWHKPPGMLSQGSKWGDHTSIARWAEKAFEPARAGYTVHRLDRAASGLILVAHDKRTAAALSGLFKERRVVKRYWALVHGSLSDAAAWRTIDAALDGRVARSRVRALRRAPDGARSLLEVRIDTGRKHQIRRHLAGIGLPLVGDRLYGLPDDHREDLRLIAWYLAFRCPVEDLDRCYRLPEAYRPGLGPADPDPVPRGGGAEADVQSSRPCKDSG